MTYLLTFTFFLFLIQQISPIFTSKIIAHYHYQHLILNIYTLLLIFAMPSVIVFIKDVIELHTFPSRSSTLFSYQIFNDHNPLMVLPFLATTILQQNRMVTVTSSRLWTQLTSCTIEIAGLCALTFGIKHTWICHPVAAIVFGWYAIQMMTRGHIPRSKSTNTKQG